MTVELFLKKALIVYLQKNNTNNVSLDDIQTFVSLKAHSDAKGIFAINRDDEESLFIVSYFGHSSSFYIKKFNRVDEKTNKIGTVISKKEIK